MGSGHRNGAGTTYNLEVEKRNRVKSQTRMRTEQGRRTDCRWRVSAMGSGHSKGGRDNVQPGGGEEAQEGQISDMTANRAGTTYFLEVERKRKRVRSQT
jgi:hypothetical protein